MLLEVVPRKIPLHNRNEWLLVWKRIRYQTQIVPPTWTFNRKLTTDLVIVRKQPVSKCHCSRTNITFQFNNIFRYITGLRYHFIGANQRKVDIKILSPTQCEISKVWCDWHTLAGNDQRIVSHNLNRVVTKEHKQKATDQVVKLCEDTSLVMYTSLHRSSVPVRKA